MKWVLVIAVLYVAANILGVGLARARGRKLPAPADVQAIQDAPDLNPPGRDLGMEAPCLLTPGEVDTFADIAHQLGDGPDWDRLADLYSIPTDEGK